MPNETTIKNLETLYRDLDLEKLAHTGDWVDIRISAVTDIEVGPQDIALDKARGKVTNIGKSVAVKIWHGFCLNLPEGYEAIVKPRGSLFKNTGLIFTCSGVIDENYKGNNDEWFSTFYSTQSVSLEHNTRICQFRIQKKQPAIAFTEVTSMSNPDRGGHGSTGVK